MSETDGDGRNAGMADGGDEGGDGAGPSGSPHDRTAWGAIIRGATCTNRRGWRACSPKTMQQDLHSPVGMWRARLSRRTERRLRSSAPVPQHRRALRRATVIAIVCGVIDVIVLSGDDHGE